MIKEITTHFLPTFMPEEPIKRTLLKNLVIFCLFLANPTFMFANLSNLSKFR